MILLALQYTLQPRLSKKFIAPKTNKSTVALAEETVKTCMAAAIFSATGATNIQQQLSQWTWSSSLAMAGLPAVLYAIQGVLQYTSHQYLDPVTFNGLTQSKTLAAALCCYFILGQPQSPLQMVALVLLFGSALLFQGRGRQPRARHYSGDNQWFVKGVLPCLAATLLSGLAGALSQRGLQLTGGTGRDPFLFTVEVSVFSAAALWANLLRQSPSSSSKPQQQQQLFRGWTTATWIPIVCKAMGGVLTALVHKSSGSVAKGFALMLGLVMSGALQSLVQEEEILPHQMVGTLLVMLSGWLHFTNPVVAN